MHYEIDLARLVGSRFEGNTVTKRISTRMHILYDIAVLVQDLVGGERNDEALAVEEMSLVLLRSLMSNSGEVDRLSVVLVDAVGLEEAGGELLFQSVRMPLGDGSELVMGVDVGLAGGVNMTDSGSILGTDGTGECAVVLDTNLEGAAVVTEAEAALAVA